MSDGEVRRGVIYVLSNPSMSGILKIGRTARLSERVRELSRPTGVPLPFEIVYDVVVSDAAGAEREVHNALFETRINPAKEFFRVPIRRAIRVVQEVAERYAVNEALESDEVEILPDLERRMRRWLRRDVVSIKFVQYPDLCVLKIVRQPDVSSELAIETLFDLRVLGDYECDDVLFSPFRRNINENIKMFLELDVYSMLMVGIDIINDEAGDYIAHLQERKKVKPPLKPSWQVVEARYDMWGPEDEWRPIVEKMKPGSTFVLRSDSAPN